MLKKLFGSLLLISALASCGPSVKFLEPQPQEISDEMEFKGKYIGRFLSKQDSTIINITNKLIVAETMKNVQIPKNYSGLNGNLVVKGSKLFGYETKPDTGLAIVKVTDSTYVVKTHNIDTVFNVGDANKLRFFKGYYFLNSRNPDKSWEVKKIGVDHSGNLGIFTLLVPDDIIRLKKVTDVIEQKDTTAKVTNFSAQPTKKQFRKFLRKNGFSQGETFKRIY